MAAQGAFGTNFYDRSILRPKHRAYYRSGRPVIKIGPKAPWAAMRSAQITPLQASDRVYHYVIHIFMWKSSSSTSPLLSFNVNFRMLIKCFDSYGWAYPNGSFSGMLQHLAEKRLDICAGGMLLIPVRMTAITYVNNYWNVE